LAWWTAVLDWVFEPYANFLQRIWLKFKPHVVKLPLDKIALRCMHWAAKLGLGKVVTDIKPDHNLRLRVLWEEAKRRGIEMFEFRPFGRSVDLLVARKGEEVFAFDGLPRPHGSPTDGLEWMDDKAIMRQKLGQAGLPIARGGMFVLVKKALQLFDEIGGPVIVKPRVGSRSRHTHIHITTRSGLVQAFYSAQKLCPWVVVEQELQGPVFRATVVAGKLVGVARRDMPQVVGDGRSTIGELVASANTHPGRDHDIFYKLPGEADLKDELERQGLTWASVPEAGAVVMLGSKVNRGIGGVTVDVTSEVHPENVALFERVAQVVADPIIGIDFIAAHLRDPWHSQTAVGVIECNSLPFIDLHHYPISGTPRNAAGAIWDLVWPERGAQSARPEAVAPVEL
jgi:D-alanine-D-alanine ligase-like ATP-grasp enzyme